MNYRQFRRALAEEICRRSGEEIEISFRDMQSNNNVHSEAITLGSGYGKFLPSIDMNLLYQEYGKGVSIRHIAKLLIHQYEEVQKKCSIPGDFFANYDRVSRRVYCKLISRAQNEKMLEEVPNRAWADLAVIVYYRMEPSLVDGGTITIRHEHLRRWGISGEELFRNAWANTASAMHPVLRPLSTVLGEFEEEEETCTEDDFLSEAISGRGSIMIDGSPEPAGPSGGLENLHGEEAGCIIVGEDDGEYDQGMLMPLQPSESGADTYCPLYILTNKEKCFGAVSIAIPGEPERIADYLRSDYYVLPSSIHECLILPDDGFYKTEFLNELVRSVNTTQVDPAEVLSDHVYHYSRLCGSFDI